MILEHAWLTATYSTDLTFTNIPGLYCNILEDGEYRLMFQLPTKSRRDAANAQGVALQLACNGTAIPKTIFGTYNDQNLGDDLYVPILFDHYGYFKKDDVITVQARHNGSTSLCTVPYSSGVYEGFLSCKKIEEKIIRERSYVVSEYTVTTSMANITGMSLTIPSDGKYFLKNYILGTMIDADSTASNLQLQLAKNGTAIPNTKTRIRQIIGAGLTIRVPLYGIYLLDLKAGDVITPQVVMGAGDDCLIPVDLFGSLLPGSFIEYIKLEEHELFEQVFMTADYTVTTSFADIPGLYLKVTEDSEYEIIPKLVNYCIDDDVSNGASYIQLTKNGNSINNSHQYLQHTFNDAYGIAANIFNCITLKLKKDDLIAVQIKMDVGDNCIVDGASFNSSILYRRIK